MIKDPLFHEESIPCPRLALGDGVFFGFAINTSEDVENSEAGRFISRNRCFWGFDAFFLDY